jgi:hypothetical protein
MVEHGRGVGDAAAAAEVGDHAVPAPALHGLHHFHGVMAHAAAFQPVKQHHQRRVGAGGVDEIIGNLRFAGAVGQQLAAVGGRRGLQQLGENGFGIAVVQPKRRVGQVYVHFSATVRMNRHCGRRRSRPCRNTTLRCGRTAEYRCVKKSLILLDVS